MKKKVCCLLAAALFMTGCGKIPKLENGQDAVVTFKNGEMISVDDLYADVKDTYALSSLVRMIDKYVLEETFSDKIEESKEYAENYYKALEETYGGEEKMLQMLNQSGIASIEAYKEMLYLNYMQSTAAEEYAKDQIKEKDIEKYYEKEVVGDIEVSHILITPKTTDKMSKDEIKKAEEEAKKEAEAIVKEIKATKKEDLAKKFTELAKKHSQDAATKDKGGALGKINKGTLSSKYDELVDVAYDLKDGEVSAKVVTTELGYHIVYRTKSYDKKALKDVKEDILETLANELLAKDKTLVVNALTHYRKELGMEIQDSELSKQYAYYIQNQLASITAAATQSGN